MTSSIKDMLRRFKYSFPRSHSSLSFSQEGEDMILNRFFSGKKNGFYVDVGAHHPWRFSNTYYFYRKGWKGINIDPMPGVMNLFNSKRPGDLNLELGISISEKDLDYYMFNEPALNSFSYEASQEALKNHNFKIIETRKIRTKPLGKVLADHLHQRQQIDFMTIDAEGYDLEVLKSNDWDKFRPEFVLAESASSNLENISECPIFSYLKTQKYSLIAKTAKTFFYQEGTERT